MFSKIKRFFRIFIRKPLFLNQSKYKIVEAFISGGVTYYQYEDTFNIPCKRGLQATVFYEEVRMKVTMEELKAIQEAQEKILNNGKSLNLVDLYRINQILKEKLNFIVVPDLVYKLASVVYFDATENPNEYDFGYGAKKIEKWKKENDINAFFLSKPITDLVPFFKEVNFDLKSYSEAIEAIRKSQNLEVTGISSNK